MNALAIKRGTLGQCNHGRPTWGHQSLDALDVVPARTVMTDPATLQSFIRGDAVKNQEKPPTLSDGPTAAGKTQFAMDLSIASSAR